MKEQYKFYKYKVYKKQRKHINLKYVYRDMYPREIDGVLGALCKIFVYRWQWAHGLGGQKGLR